MIMFSESPVGLEDGVYRSELDHKFVRVRWGWKMGCTGLHLENGVWKS